MGFSSQGAVYAISRLGRRKFLLFTTIQAAAVQESVLAYFAGTDFSASNRLAAYSARTMQ